MPNGKCCMSYVKMNRTYRFAWWISNCDRYEINIKCQIKNVKNQKILKNYEYQRFGKKCHKMLRDVTEMSQNIKKLQKKSQEIKTS